MENLKPSENLLDLSLSDDWKVIEKITNHDSTGGFFSCGYKVQKGNSFAYLKALDFAKALSAKDMMTELQFLTEAFNFERDLLEKCKEKRMSKIVKAITSGKVSVPGYPPFIKDVHYIIFELADGDIRIKKDQTAKLDLAFIFRALHNTAVGLKQLHTNNIAHQDIKPSNVLAFSKDYKIADLGRSSDKGKKFHYDDVCVAGDLSYASMEQKYNYSNIKGFNKDFNAKYAVDMYLFGSLFSFFFTGLSATQAMIDKGKKLKASFAMKDFDADTMKDFDEDLPEISRVFTEVLLDFKKTLKLIPLPDEVINEVTSLVRYLCHPDPRKRGFPENIKSNANQYDLERFISRLDVLATKAENDLLYEKKFFC